MQISIVKYDFINTFCAAAILFSAATLNAQSQYTYTTLDVMDGSSTYATGISGTNIVGYYNDTSGDAHGFLYDGCSYTTLDVPQAQDTYARGICGTNIVGYYYDTNGNANGFLYDGCNYTTVDVPGAPATYAHGICGTNIVGYYYDTNYETHGFFYNGCSYTPLDVPEALATYANGICGTNIVGYYYDTSGDTHGFLYNGCSYITLDVPGAQATYANGICGTNIVGYYYDTSYDAHGFLYNNCNYATLDAPGPQFTEANGISGNSIVGFFVWNYITDFGEYSFLATLDLDLGSPSLQIEQGAGEMILQWPVNYAGFMLQTATNLDRSAAWTCYAATPIVNGPNFNVTVVPDEAQRYFRLSQPASGSASPLDEWTLNQTLSDSGSDGNDLTAMCSPGFVAGLNDFDAMSFDGINQYVTSDNNLGVTGLNFTFTGWVSSGSDAPDQNVFVWEDNASGLYFIIGNGSTLIGGTGKTGWVIYGAAPAGSGAQSAWFFALVSTAAGFTCYTNGVIAGIGPPLFDTGFNPIPSDSVRIGYSLNMGPTYALDGTVQDFGVYNTNLTASQVYSLYSAGAQ